MDVNNFGQFNAEVWGTVSDWAMVTVTGLTAWFLWKTLKSQSKVQRDQNELTRIEQYWHRDKLKPRLEMKAEQVKDISTAEDNIIDISFSFTFLDNDAHKVKYSVKNNDDWKLTIGPSEQLLIKKDITKIFYGRFQRKKGKKFGEIFVTNLDFNVLYEDADLNKYSIGIAYHNIDGANFVNVGIPELLKP